MTRTGLRALRRFARTQSWNQTRLQGEVEQIDRLATGLISRDSNLNEEDREWLEVFIQASTDPDKSLKKTAAAIVGLHYRGVPDNATIH